MPRAAAVPTTVHEERHKDGSLWARGLMRDGRPHGYWEWFRRNGVKLRSGHLESGESVGEWVTYDAKGQPYKVTQIRPGRPSGAGSKSSRR